MKTIERFKDLKIGRRRSRCEPKAWQSQREIPRFTRNGVCNLLIVTALCSLLPALLQGQVDTAWVRRYNGTGNDDDRAYAIAVDGSGNVYVTGGSYGSGTSEDYATIKYNSSGIQQWSSRYNGPGNDGDGAYAIALDVAGNVYVTGWSSGFGTFLDYATIKYNSTGIQQWVTRYNGPGNSYDGAYAIVVDGSGNIYVTGYSYGPGTDFDYATIKYNSVGVQQWVSRYNGPGNAQDLAFSIAVDDQGNAYVTGWSHGSDTVYDYATIKYNSAGIQQWVARYDYSEEEERANSITIDGQGNVYVTGSSYNLNTYFDYATIKYNAVGETLWVRRYNGSGNYWDEASSVAIDGQGNVYVSGYSDGLGTSEDYATIKYNSAGVQQWVARYNGPGNYEDWAHAMALDGSGNVYVTGYSTGSGTEYDYATIKYNSNGVEQWVQRYNGPGNDWDWAYAIALDGSGNVYITGVSYGSGTSIDYATIKYVQTPGIEEDEIATLPLAMTKSVEVYPNPAKTYFTIRLPQLWSATTMSLQAKSPILHSKIRMYNVTGKVVKEILRSAQNDNNVRISLDGIKNGVYFIQVGNEMVKEKLVVTR